MIGMCIEKLRYPEWYQINKKSSENEDEEKYLELRNDLIQFLEPFVKIEQFKIFIAQFIDQKVQESSSAQQLDIRQVDIIFTLIQIFVNRKVETEFIVQKYSFILFSDRIQQPDCQIFSDIVIDIYQQLDMNTLTQENLTAVFNFLFSGNGIMSN